MEDRDIDCVSVLTWSVHALLTAGLNGSHLLIRVDVWEVLAKIVTHCCKIKRWWSHPRQSLPDCFYSHSPASFSKLWLPICNVWMTIDQNIAAYVAHKSDENYGQHGVIRLIAGGCFHKKAFSLSHRGVLVCSLQSKSLQLVHPTWVCRHKVDLLMIYRSIYYQIEIFSSANLLKQWCEHRTSQRERHVESLLIYIC